MNERDPSPASPPESLSRDAATWFARMRAPDAAKSRAAFDAWLAQDAAHRSAYNRAAEIFAMGKLLQQTEPSPAARNAGTPRTLALTVCAACALGLGGWFSLHAPVPPGALPGAAVDDSRDNRSLWTVAGETRMVRLADGSKLRLGGNSIVEVHFTASGRRLDLRRGEARFEVAHERRPFVVLAGGGSVTARGTVFDVALTTAGRVDVRLLRGAIDVALPAQRPDGEPGRIRRLAAGESLSFAARSGAPRAPAASPTVPDSGAGAALPSAHDFTAVPVTDLVAAANRGATRPIRLADASLSVERVSGRFRVDDTALLARRLAALFGWTADFSDPKEILLRQ